MPWVQISRQDCHPKKQAQDKKACFEQGKAKNKLILQSTARTLTVLKSHNPKLKLEENLPKLILLEETVSHQAAASTIRPQVERNIETPWQMPSIANIYNPWTVQRITGNLPIYCLFNRPRKRQEVDENHHNSFYVCR